MRWRAVSWLTVYGHFVAACVCLCRLVERQLTMAKNSNNQIDVELCVFAKRAPTTIYTILRFIFMIATARSSRSSERIGLTNICNGNGWGKRIDCRRWSRQCGWKTWIDSSLTVYRLPLDRDDSATSHAPGLAFFFFIFLSFLFTFTLSAANVVRVPNDTLPTNSHNEWICKLLRCQLGQRSTVFIYISKETEKSHCKPQNRNHIWRVPGISKRMMKSIN